MIRAIKRTSDKALGVAATLWLEMTTELFADQPDVKHDKQGWLANAKRLRDGGNYDIFFAVDDKEGVVGFSDRLLLYEPAYSMTAAHSLSIYIRKEFRGRGIRDQLAMAMEPELFPLVYIYTEHPEKWARLGFKQLSITMQRRF
jgi:GNAT superfamily N-acetyltransferase